MKTKLALLVICITFFFTTNFPVVAESQEFQSRRLIRSEGECHVFIPCPIYGPASPSWSINSSIYAVSSLHVDALFQPVYNGLVIVRINKTLNEIPIQCIISSEKGQEAIEGPISIIIVQSPGFEGSTCSYSSEFRIHLDAQVLFFSNDSVTFGWKVPRVPEVQFPMCDQLNMFQVDVKNCYHEAIRPPNTIPFRNISLPYSELVRNESEIHYVTIQGFRCGNNTCECNSTSLAFEVESQNVRTRMRNVALGREYCIEVPLKDARGTLHVLLPASLTDRDRKDVDCPLYNGSSDLMLSNCVEFMNSNYRHNTDIVMDEDRGHKMCINNVTTEVNNTRIHFFYETQECTRSPSRQQFGDDQHYHRFVRSYWLVTREVPNEPNVTFNDGELCFSSSPSDNISASYFEILIHDITKQVVLNQYTNLTCINIDNFLKQNACAPYEVFVRAYGHEEHGTFSETMITLDNDTDTSLCDCVWNHWVTVNMTSIRATRYGQNVNISLLCNHTSKMPASKNITFIIIEDGNSGENRSFLCNNTMVNLNYSDFPKNVTDLEYRVVWKHGSNKCEFNGSLNITASGVDNSLRTILLSVLIPTVVVVITLAIIIGLILCKGYGVCDGRERSYLLKRTGKKKTPNE